LKYQKLFKALIISRLQGMHCCAHKTATLNPNQHTVSRILFRFVIFNCYNISICKKEKLKAETSKKIRETNGGQIKEQDVPLT
jgi:hypothetical protein